MEHKVLARKYRPLRLADVVGHDLTKKIIESALTHNNLSHALLLTGIRGIGKTTIARIIAKSLACRERGTSPEPCEKCDSCIKFQEGKHTDIYEMDAASHTSVDDVRAIIETVGYQPVLGRFKVYVIDEVHMLSKNAFNALLKTLEEPPAHVYFIFATTEVNKVPDTILSRCLQVNLLPFPEDQIFAHLKNVCESDKLQVSSEALRIIARTGQGSMRDALSLLEQIKPLSLEEEVSGQEVRDILGILDPENLSALYTHVKEQKQEEALKELEALYGQGIEPKTILETFLEKVHAGLKEASDAKSASQLQRYWSILVKGAEEMKMLPMAREVLDVTIIRMIQASGLPPVSEIIEHLKKKPLKTNVGETAAKSVASSPHSSMAFVEALTEHNKLMLAGHLRHNAVIKEFKRGEISIVAKKDAPNDFKKQLEKACYEIFGEKWIVDVEKGDSGANNDLTLHEKHLKDEQEKLEKIKQNEMVEAILKAFPNSSIKIH